MRARLLVLIPLGISLCSEADAPLPVGVYVCRSPLLAFNFWESLLHVSQELKIKLTHDIVAQLAADQKCIRVSSENLRPIKSGWGGALALADGDKSPVYFHQPDTLGWVHPDYYVQYVNDERVRRARSDPNGQNQEQRVPTAAKVPHAGSVTALGASDVYKVGSDVVAPRLYYKIEPSYTREAHDRHVQGTVVLYIDVEPSGTPDNIKVIKSLDAGLDRKAIEAVRQWRFDPGTKSGKPVTVAATIEVKFQLGDDPE